MCTYVYVNVHVRSSPLPSSYIDVTQLSVDPYINSHLQLRFRFRFLLDDVTLAQPKLIYFMISNLMDVNRIKSKYSGLTPYDVIRTLLLFAEHNINEEAEVEVEQGHQVSC